MTVKQVLTAGPDGELHCGACDALLRPMAEGTSWRVILHADDCSSVRAPEGTADVIAPGAFDGVLPTTVPVRYGPGGPVIGHAEVRLDREPGEAP